MLDQTEVHRAQGRWVSDVMPTWRPQCGGERVQFTPWQTVGKARDT